MSRQLFDVCRQYRLSFAFKAEACHDDDDCFQTGFLNTRPIGRPNDWPRPKPTPLVEAEVTRIQQLPEL